MSAWAEPVWFREEAPRLLTYCRICNRQTPHEVTCAPDGAPADVCVACLIRALVHQLEEK